MDLQIELYSTPTVEGKKILSSKGFVCANVTLDASVIHGYEELPKYIDKDGVEPYHVELFDALEKETLAKGANAVIDLHIEHSYVHTGYGYKLLISAQGTAVVLDGISIPENKNIKGYVLEQQILRKQVSAEINGWYEKFEETIKNGEDIRRSNILDLEKIDIERTKRCCCTLSAEEWEFLCRCENTSFADYLHLAYSENVLYVIEERERYTDNRISSTKFSKYFKKLSYEKQIELAYKYCGLMSWYLIDECDLFDAKRILDWAQKGELEFATVCLKARKKEYSEQDLEDMQSLYDFLANLQNGLTKEQEEMVKDFGIKLEALKELLSRNK